CTRAGIYDGYYEVFDVW
nr:immunoglobulin heavy chain junction region [Mus musculus]